jgi:hypothetical protein
VTFNDYNSFSKRPPMNCKFEPEMLEAYLSLENAPELISDIVQDHILEFDETNEIKL